MLINRHKIGKYVKAHRRRRLTVKPIQTEITLSNSEKKKTGEGSRISRAASADVCFSSSNSVSALRGRKKRRRRRCRRRPGGRRSPEEENNGTRI